MGNDARTVICNLRLERRETLEWLERAFGFALAEVTVGDDGELHHAQLSWGSGVIMVATTGRLPQPTGVSVLYLTVATDAEVDALHERAVAAGAESVQTPEDMDYGGRGATVADPEGNLWSVGSYRPTQG